MHVIAQRLGRQGTLADRCQPRFGQGDHLRRRFDVHAAAQGGRVVNPRRHIVTRKPAHALQQRRDEQRRRAMFALRQTRHDVVGRLLVFVADQSLGQVVDAPRLVLRQDIRHRRHRRLAVSLGKRLRVGQVLVVAPGRGT